MICCMKGEQKEIKRVRRVGERYGRRTEMHCGKMKWTVKQRTHTQIIQVLTGTKNGYTE